MPQFKWLNCISETIQIERISKIEQLSSLSIYSINVHLSTYPYVDRQMHSFTSAQTQNRWPIDKQYSTLFIGTMVKINTDVGMLSLWYQFTYVYKVTNDNRSITGLLIE